MNFSIPNPPFQVAGRGAGRREHYFFLFRFFADGLGADDLVV
jgi:hypothetical protein